MGTAYAIEGSIKRRRSTPVKKSLKQKFRDWLFDNNEEVNEIGRIALDPGHSLDSSESLRFSVYRASGGLIVETRKYDHRKDQHHNQLHIVTDEKNLGSELAKIITMEALRG